MAGKHNKFIASEMDYYNQGDYFSEQQYEEPVSTKYVEQTTPEPKSKNFEMSSKNEDFPSLGQVPKKIVRKKLPKPKDPKKERMLEEKRKKKEQEKEIKKLVQELEKLTKKEKEIKDLIKMIISDVNEFEKYNMNIFNLINNHYNMARNSNRHYLASEFYKQHLKFLKSNIIVKNAPEVISKLKDLYYDNQFDEFINSIGIYDINIIDFKKVIINYIKIICDIIFSTDGIITKLFNKIYELTLEKNEIFDQIKHLYQKFSFSRQKIESELIPLFREYYKHDFMIKDYFFGKKSRTPNISLLSIVLDIKQSELNYTLRKHINSFKQTYKLPFEIQRQRTINMTREMENRQREERVRYDTRYQQIKEREERNRIQAEERELLFQKQLLERSKDERLKKARQKYEKKYNQLKQQLEKQFTQYDEELNGYKYQDPESKYNKFMRSMDERFKITPEEYICPISLQIMSDPVVAADGITYDRNNIEKWFEDGNNKSPTTGAPLTSLILIPNINLKKIINEFK